MKISKEQLQDMIKEALKEQVFDLGDPETKARMKHISRAMEHLLKAQEEMNKASIVAKGTMASKVFATLALKVGKIYDILMKNNLPKKVKSI